MATVNRFEDLEIWTMARELAGIVWKLCQSEDSLRNDRELRWALNKTAGSVMDNIAEGFGRGGNKEFLHFLSIALGSAEELKSQIYRTQDRSHLSLEKTQELFQMIEELKKKLKNMMRYLRKTEFAGPKYKK
jgi:four helix bundle protein